MKPAETLAVAVRPLVLADAPDLYGLIDRNRPELAKFWWEQTTQSVADSEAFIQSVRNLEEQNGAPTRGITVQEKLIGVCALHSIDWEAKTSLLGYWLDKEQSGHGYATEAVRQLLTTEAFGRLGLAEVRIDTRASNQSSRHIAEKLGFELVSITDEPLWKTEEQLVETALYCLKDTQFIPTTV